MKDLLIDFAIIFGFILLSAEGIYFLTIGHEPLGVFTLCSVVCGHLAYLYIVWKGWD